ncbi:MAG: acetolactate synthase-1/2/3 large subunit [Chloroflexi bacterium]|nr:MAG: acetolactate synthase-1/2/3 large subunit [Chloroflexota bacterium]
MISGAHLLVRALKAEGIDTVFTLVGDHILPLIDALEDEGVHLVDTRHEAAALHMADAYTRVTGLPAVAITTGGPGHANAVAGLPMAWMAETPLVFISGTPESYLQGMWNAQEIPQVEMARPTTKGAWQIPDAHRIPEFVSRAFRTATEGRPGPVYLAVPVDVQEQKVEEGEAKSYQPQQVSRSLAPMGDVDRVLDLLEKAERPVVIAGGPAWFSASRDELTKFIETVKIPIFTVELSRGLVSDDHPLCFGYADRALNETYRLVSQADVVLLLGKKLDARIGFGRPPSIAASAKVIQVEPSADAVGVNRTADAALVGDIGAIVAQLTERAASRDWRELPWAGELRTSAEATRKKWDAVASEAEAIHPLHVAKDVEALLEDDAMVIIDGGDYVQWPRLYLRARRPGGWLRLGPLGQLGAGLPFALACRYADPNAQVVLFMGDGSLGFYLAEFDTAIRHNLPIVVVLGNDALWSIDRNFQLAYYGRAVATDLRSIRYDKVVEAMGGHGELVERRDDLPAALDRAFKSGKPALVNIVINPAQSPLADAMIARKRSQP